MSSMEAQKVVVIQDASRDVNSSAIRWAIVGLSLKPGDELTLLSILHEVYTPTNCKLKGGGNSMLGSNQGLIMREVSSKEEEYRNSIEMLQIKMWYEKKQITFHTRVVAASYPKAVAVDLAKEVGATWIILDRQMKKEKKYFMERLTCGISSMKSNNTFKLVRGPIFALEKAKNTEKNLGTSTRCNEKVQIPLEKPEASQMIKESPTDDGHFCLEFAPAKSTSTYKCSSKDEQQTDKKEEHLGLSVMTSFLSKLSSSEMAPYVSQEDKEKLMNSSLDKAKYYLGQHHGENGFVADVNAQLPIATSNHNSMQDLNSILGTSFDATKDKAFKPHKEQADSSTSNIPEFRYYTEPEGEKEDCMSISCATETRIGIKIDFTYAELYNASNRFSDENFLSQGGFGCVYKGRLKDGQYIAVKQLKLASLQGEREFRSEVDVLSKVRHKNVVMLLGSCAEGSHRLLVYEYVANGSLDTHLSKNKSEVLSWRNRMKIALGTAKGLNYLHQKNIIHRDMRPSNILIRSNYEPLLGDFGLAREQHETKESLENNVAGTIGYLAPEYAEKGRASAKIDVYSFGVVLVQLITGRTTTDKSLLGQSLLGWAKPLLKERKYPELIDERIHDSHDVHQLFCMISVAEKCIRKDPDKRPSMEKVEYAIQCIVDGETASSLDDFSPRISSFSSLTTSNESQTEQDSELQDLASFDSSPSRRWINQAYTLASYTQKTSRSINRYIDFEASSFETQERYLGRKEARYANQKLLYDEMLT